MSGLSKKEIDDSPVLQLSLRAAMAETVGVPLNFVGPPIVQSVFINAQLFRILSSMGVIIEMVITCIKPTEAVLFILQSQTQNFTANFVEYAIGDKLKKRNETLSSNFCLFLKVIVYFCRKWLS
jgi:hypothetical protein